MPIHNLDIAKTDLNLLVVFAALVERRSVTSPCSCCCKEISCPAWLREHWN